jgi:hypothetical protein
VAHRDLILASVEKRNGIFGCERLCGPGAVLVFLRMERLR